MKSDIYIEFCQRCGHQIPFQLKNSYEEVIAVIGMNPEKVYSVSPAKRASILKQMIASIGLKDSVRVEGEHKRPFFGRAYIVYYCVYL